MGKLWIIVLLLAISGVNAATITKVEAGYSGYYKTGCWFPVNVEISSNRAFNGEILVNQFHMPVHLQPNEKRSYEIPVFLTNATPSIPVRLIERGRVVDERSVSLLPQNRFLILTVVPLPSGEDYHVVEIKKLPGWASLDCADLVVAENLSSELKKYALAGGRVLILSTELRGKRLEAYLSREKAGRGYIFFADRKIFQNWDEVLENYLLYLKAERKGSRALTLVHSFEKTHGLQIALFLLLYTLAVGPVNYLFLRRVKKLELGWITIPSVVLLFSALAFAIGYMNWGLTPEVIESGEILSTANGSHVISEVGVISARRGEYEIYFQSGERILGYKRYFSEVIPVELYYSNPRKTEDFLPMWSIRGYRAEFIIPMGVQGEAEIVNGTLRGYVVSDVPVSNAYFFWHGYTAFVGDLKPGEVKNFTQPLNKNLPKVDTVNGRELPVRLMEILPEVAEEYSPVIAGITNYTLNISLGEEFKHQYSYLIAGRINLTRIAGQYSFYVSNGRVVRGSAIKAYRNSFVAEPGEVIVVMEIPTGNLNISKIVANIPEQYEFSLAIYNWKTGKWENLSTPAIGGFPRGIQLKHDEHVKASGILKFKYTVMRSAIPPENSPKPPGIYLPMPAIYVEVQG